MCLCVCCSDGDVVVPFGKEATPKLPFPSSLQYNVRLALSAVTELEL